jgi:hypothetical protein
MEKNYHYLEYLTNPGEPSEKDPRPMFGYLDRFFIDSLLHQLFVSNIWRNIIRRRFITLN